MITQPWGDDNPIPPWWWLDAERNKKVGLNTPADHARHHLAMVGHLEGQQKHLIALYVWLVLLTLTVVVLVAR